MEEWRSTENRPSETKLEKQYSQIGRKHTAAQGKAVVMPSRRVIAKQQWLSLDDDKEKGWQFPPLPYGARD